MLQQWTLNEYPFCYKTSVSWPEWYLYTLCFCVELLHFFKEESSRKFVFVEALFFDGEAVIFTFVGMSRKMYWTSATTKSQNFLPRRRTVTEVINRSHSEVLSGSFVLINTTSRHEIGKIIFFSDSGRICPEVKWVNWSTAWRGTARYFQVT